jgi:hypothetical protein
MEVQDMPWWGVLLIILAIAIALLVVLYFAGKKLQARQTEAEAQMQANKQTVSLLVIDKKRMKIKDAQLPAGVIDQIPKMQRNLKAPLAKVKIGPQILTMFVDEKVFDSLPIKKEVKAEISGMYIISVKGMHGTVIKKDEKKKGFFKRALEKAQEKAGATSVK